MKGWIYKLTKDQLICELESLNIDSRGKHDDLRKKLSQYVDLHPEYALTRLGMSSDTETPTRATGATVATSSTIIAAKAVGPLANPFATPPPIVPNRPPLTETEPSSAMNQIRKWGCHFDGKDPLSFLERVDELRHAYNVSTTQLLAGLPELQRGDSLLWYRNNRGDWQTWEDFD